MVKTLPAVWETRVPSLGWEDPLEEGMTTHSSILAWRIPWTEEPGQLHSMGSQRVRHDWATNTHTHHNALGRTRHTCVGVVPWPGQLVLQLAQQSLGEGTGSTATSCLPLLLYLGLQSLHLNHFILTWAESLSVFDSCWRPGKVSFFLYAFHFCLLSPWSIFLALLILMKILLNITEAANAHLNQIKGKLCILKLNLAQQKQ